ncbi:MAG: hypothetical protein ACE5Q6_07205 [Dehalococcoidia bacterium]
MTLLATATAVPPTRTVAHAPTPTATPVPAPTETPAPAVPARSDTPQERLSDIFSFTLESFSVPVGTRVVWTNRDRAPHTATSGVAPTKDGVWDSGVLPIEGGGFIFVFKEAGKFPYFCQCILL